MAMALGDIKGHASIRQLVGRAVTRDTLPPCLVFTGPEGVGKRRLALAVAQLLNCHALTGDDQTGPDACGACRACERIQRGVHADVLVLEPGETGAIKVDAVRAVVEQTMYRPFEGRKRVVIVDDADRLVPEAQNALLKTLEEPPDGSVFLLVTSRPHMLLPTVRSRCPELRFGGLAPGDIVDLLVQEHGFESVAARAAAATADGSLARALEAGSTDHLQARESATAMLRALASAPNPRQRLEAGKGLVDVRPGRKSSPAADRETLKRRLRALSTLFRDLQVLASRGEVAWLSNVDLAPDLADLARSYDTDRAQRGYVSVDRAVQALTRNASPKVVVDWLTLQL
ncbi:MAG: DNA polymerase III subunit delta' [Acidobacteria bacterium]|nr:DNA polymerase III subunit delta' [Acidobacteriota bacterium]